MLEELITRAQARWPSVRVDAQEVRAHAERVLPEGMSLDALLAGEHALDLCLACACAQGDPGALAVFEAEIVGGIAPAIARIDRAAAFADEIAQELRIKLLVAEPGQSPRVARYAARGPLRSWVQVAAIRAACDRKRRPDAAASEGNDDALLEASFLGHPEADAIRAQSRAVLRAALAQGMAALSARERTVLRMHLVEDVSTESIARIYRVHRATVARWISAAHQSVLSDLKRALMRDAGLGPEALESLLRVAGSQLSVSLSVLLR